MFRVNRHVVIALTLGMVFCAGCADRLKTEPVSGLVTLDGEPVPGAIVTFTPIEDGKGLAAFGTTNERGIYKLTAQDSKAVAEAGTLPGDYKISVMKNQADTVVSQEEAQTQGVAATERAAGKAPELTYLVPRKYNSPNNSGLTATVKQGANDIPLVLTSNNH